MEYFVNVLKKWNDFHSRSRRKEYWMFCLVNFAISCIYYLGMLGLSGSEVLQHLYELYSLVVAIPGLAVAVRRLHDVGRSGWWLLIGLVPILGVILLLVWACTAGQLEENKWGKNPKLEEEGVDL